MSYRVGDVKLEIDDWYITKSDGWPEHRVWHMCGDTQHYQHWLVFYGTHARAASSPGQKEARWRCCHCGIPAPEGIMGAHILLESDWTAERVQHHVNNT